MVLLLETYLVGDLSPSQGNESNTAQYPLLQYYCSKVDPETLKYVL